MDSKTAKTPKHVIILGAGASASSGYPVGNDLRLWMSSPRSLRERIEVVLKKGVDADRLLILQHFDEWIKPVEKALQLFREGDFASVDEFCRLAGNRLENEVKQLKKVLRLALSIHDPEDHYEQSDYYGFVQRLFQPNLVDLRDDVVVLSFKYDVYLEFLLRRAAGIRQEVTKGKSHTELDLLTSGFSNRNIQLIEGTDKFCLLKLHGAVAWPNAASVGSKRDDYCWYGDILGSKASDRIRTLTSEEIGQSESPIVFPWEIIGDEGHFRPEDEFPCRDSQCLASQLTGAYNGPTTQFQLFKSIWTRAKAEVFAANRISIVGLSLHEYLIPGLRFLLEGKSGDIELVVADKCLQGFAGERQNEAQFDLLTPVARLDQLLRETCPDLRWNVQKGPSRVPIPPAKVEALVREPIVLHSSFEDFILKELGTGTSYRGVVQIGNTVQRETLKE